MKPKKKMPLALIIVIILVLGVIFVLLLASLIATPKILNTMNDAKKASMISSAKMLAAAAEREYAVREYEGKSTNIKCSEAITLSATDYDMANCTIKFDASGNATVDLPGKAGGNFAGNYVCNATRLSATVTTTPCS